MKWKTFLHVVTPIVIVVLVSCAATSVIQESTTITLNPDITYQTLTGWEVLAYAAGEPLHSASYPLYLDTLIDRAVNEVGINRVRLEIYPVAENPVDYAAMYFNGVIDEGEFIKVRAGQSVNDNTDPAVINPSGFHFTWIDHKVDDIVEPLKVSLEANGESLYVNLNFVDFYDSDFELFLAPDEYAEFILATFEHLQSKYGWVPDAVEVILEPDNTPWNGTQIGNNIVATASKLQAAGFAPDFIAPSNTSMSNAVTYFDDLIQVPGVEQYLTELSYHRYSGVSLATLQAIASRGAQYGIGTAMLEWWSTGNTYHTLHEDLKVGNNSAWQQDALAQVGTPDSKPLLFKIDESDTNNPQVVMNNSTKYFRQYYKFIRRGAVRIEATTNNNAFDPLAFINTDGRYVVVVNASNGGSFSIQGLPAGTYGIKYTTGTANQAPIEYDVDVPDVIIGTGQVLSTNIPALGVITVYAKTPPDNVTISGMKTGFAGVSAAFTATVKPVTTMLPITYTWHASGQSPIINTGGLSDTVTFKWNVTGLQEVMVTASNALGQVSDTHNVTVVIGKKHYIPLIHTDYPPVQLY